MKTLLIALAAVAFTAANAVMSETEPNNSFATANLITRGAAPWSDVGTMSLGVVGDIDFFSINLNFGEIFTVVTTPEPPTYETPDTYMGLFDNAHALLAFDDDSGSGRGSLVQWQATYTGAHYVAVTGFGDINFTGNHDISGAYILTASIVLVPEPATVMAISTGLALLAFRRRK